MASHFAQKVDERLDLPEIMRDHLRFELVDAGDGIWRTSCPDEGPDFEHDPFRSLELVRGDDGVVRWHCLGDCGRRGRTIDAVVHFADGVEDHLGAVLWLEERYPGALADLFLGVA